MLLPFSLLAGAVAGEVEAGSSDPGLRILPKGANVIGQIGKSMILVGLPEPVRRGQGEIPAAGFAFAQCCFGPLERARVRHQRPKQESKTNNRAQRAEG